ncbi:hypothetical protein AURDEDRAFT_117808, partial [Auricularia subglabra TFB-10046 SS5]
MSSGPLQTAFRRAPWGAAGCPDRHARRPGAVIAELEPQVALSREAVGMHDKENMLVFCKKGRQRAL